MDPGHAPRAASRAALAGYAALLGYGWLKAAWGLGSAVGVRDIAAWDAMKSQRAGWIWLAATWGTVALDVAGAVILAALAVLTRRREGGARPRVLRGAAWLGVVLTGPVGVIGIGSVLGPLLGLWPDDGGPLETWVFALVYGSFCVVAVAFAVAARASAAVERRPAAPPWVPER